MDPQRMDLKHTDNYPCLENNASTPFLTVLDSKFLEITFCCVGVEAKKDR